MKYLLSAKQFLFNAGLFIRFPALGGSIIMALFGAVSVFPAASLSQILPLVLGAVAFHTFAFVLNDVVDLPVDATDPRRAQFPLVRGLIRPYLALLIALLQIPLALAITAWQGEDSLAYAVLLAGFLLMAVYDVWGKRLFFPPLTDVAQGIAWGCLGLWAAAVTPGDFTPPTWILFAFLVLFIVLINGLHGSLRDLPNDYEHGVRSTAVLLGARPQEPDGIFIPPRLRRYAAGLQAGLIAITLLPLLSNSFDYKVGVWMGTGTAVLLLNLLSWRLLMKSLDAAADRASMVAPGALHLLVSFGSLVALFAFRLPWWLRLVVLPLYLAPLLTHSWIRNTLQWAWRSHGFRRIPPPNFPTPQPRPSSDQHPEATDR